MLCGGMFLYVAIDAQTNIFVTFIHFRIGLAFEPGSNVNWTSRTRSGAFGPRFNHMAKPEPAFSSAFTNFAQEPDFGSTMWQVVQFEKMTTRNSLSVRRYFLQLSTW